MAEEGGVETFVFAVVVDTMFGVEGEVEAHRGGLWGNTLGPTKGERVGLFNGGKEEGVLDGPIGMIGLWEVLVKTAPLRATIPEPNHEGDD